MTAELSTVKLTTIDPNPFRQLAEYPYNEDKLTALRRSIREVGLWEGVIGRRAGNRIQVAFGHHRLEAARQELGDGARVPIIVRDLTDQEMLQFMGRENLEDYNADFLVMLETWEAADTFLRGELLTKTQDADIARLLGWTMGTKSDDSIRINDTAKACASAARLISGGYLSRSQ